MALIFSFMIPALAASVPPVTVAWKASPEAGVRGYELKYGTVSGTYTKTLDAGMNTRISVAGLQEDCSYFFAVVVYDQVGARSLPSPERKYRTPTATESNDDPVWSGVSRSNWKLVRAAGGQRKGRAAAFAFDRDPTTFWRSKKRKKKRQEFRIDLGKSRSLNGFEYLTRQDGKSAGSIRKYRFYVSSDGVHWGKPVSRGAFSASQKRKRVFFPAKEGRFIRLVSLGKKSCSIAELKVSRVPRSNDNSAAGQLAGAAAFSQSFSAFAPLGAGSSLAAETGVIRIDGRKYRTLTVRKPSPPDGMKCTVQVSPNLVDWFSGDKHTTVVTDNGGFLKVRDNTPFTVDGKRYIRLKTTRP